ncbi:MAG TPA: hypothetical protein VIV56_01890 [Gemmatimonadales bacterium]
MSVDLDKIRAKYAHYGETAKANTAVADIRELLDDFGDVVSDCEGNRRCAEEWQKDAARYATNAADWQLKFEAAAAERDRLAEQVRQQADVIAEAKRLIAEEHVHTATKMDLPPFDAYTGEPTAASYAVECSVCGWVGENMDDTCLTSMIVAALPDVPTPTTEEK